MSFQNQALKEERILPEQAEEPGWPWQAKAEQSRHLQQECVQGHQNGLSKVDRGKATLSRVLSPQGQAEEAPNTGNVSTCSLQVSFKDKHR